jgi:glutathione peroxidase
MKIYDYKMPLPSGDAKPLSDYAGKVLLIVNTASKCGFTPQYEGLEALYKQYKDEGFEILAYPCNQFGAQEPGDATEIANFCSVTYDISFPLADKVAVNGEEADPLWKYLKQQQAGLMGSRQIKWNFTKFLVDRKGNVVARFGSMTKPEQLVKDIEKLL